MEINVIRNNQQYGPYNEQTLLSYVNSGQILLHDKAVLVGESTPQTVRYYLNKAGLKCKRENKGNISKKVQKMHRKIRPPAHFQQGFYRIFRILQTEQLRALIFRFAGQVDVEPPEDFDVDFGRNDRQVRVAAAEFRECLKRLFRVLVGCGVDRERDQGFVGMKPRVFGAEIGCLHLLHRVQKMLRDQL